MNRSDWTLIALTFFFVVVPLGLITTVVLVGMSGCGAWQQDIDYGQELARCYAHQRDIVQREGTTEAEDFADYELETQRCDAVLDEMEAEAAR